MVIDMNKGFSLIDLLISAAISMVILAMFVQQISFATKMHVDNGLMQSTHNEAQAVINIIGIDLRMIGNGLPFEVNDFAIGSELENASNVLGIPDVTFPILVADTDHTTIKYRLNETGNVFMTKADFTITSTEFSIVLNEVDGLLPGDRVYLTNKSLTGYDGLWGRIKNHPSAVDSATTTVILDAQTAGYGFWKSPGSSFNAGSILEPVTDVILANEVIGGVPTITKDNGLNKLVLARNASFELSYFNENGTEIDRVLEGEATVLLEEDIVNRNLRYIQLTVNVTSDKNLSAIGDVGNPYTASITHSFGIRNLRSK